VGSGHLHPVQQVRDGLPARRDPGQGLRPGKLAAAPATFKSMDFKGNEFKGMKYTIQVAPEDCTGCTPVRGRVPGQGQVEPEAQVARHAPAEAAPGARGRELRVLPGPAGGRSGKVKLDVKGSQFFQPLFELLGRVRGVRRDSLRQAHDAAVRRPAADWQRHRCSSIYGGNLPTAPYTTNPDGRGPAWSNSLFEDNAEFGFGMRLAIDKNLEQARELLVRLAAGLGDELVDPVCCRPTQSTEAGIAEQRTRVAGAGAEARRIRSPEARWLENIADYLVKKSVWIVGGTAGRTTSGTAAWITCWPWDAT